MAAFDQLKLLIWKNFILQKRRPIATAVELILPILFSCLLIVIRTQIDITKNPNITQWNSYDINRLPEFDPTLVPANKTWHIGFAPKNAHVVKEVMDKFVERMNKDTKTNTEKACGFVNDDIIKDLKALSDLRTDLTKLSIFQKAVQSAATKNKISFTKQLEFLRRNSSELTNVVKDYLIDLQSCITTRSKILSTQSFGNRNFNSTNTTTGMIPFLKAFERLLLSLPIIPRVEKLPFGSQSSFDNYMQDEKNLKHVLAGVIFEGFGDNKSSISDDIKLTFRFHADPINNNRSLNDRFGVIRNTWRTNLLFPTVMYPKPRGDSKYGGRPNYYKEGFLSSMHGVALSIAEILKEKSITNDYLSLERYPHPPYMQDEFIMAVKNTLPLIIMLSFFYTVVIIVKSVVYEKEARMKEYMKMMGLANWLHWLAWYLKYIVFLTISCLIMAVLYKIEATEGGAVLRNSDFSLIFFFLFLFSSSTITLGFLLSTFFTKANVAAAAGGVLYGLTYMPVFFMGDRLENIPTYGRILLSILSNVAMGNACQLIGVYESRGSGLKWSNFNVPPSVDESFSFLHVIIMLIFDSIFYMLLASYIERVYPGDHGTPLPWYFPFTRNYWCSGRTKNSSNDLRAVEEQVSSSVLEADDEFFEKEPTNKKLVTKVQNLRKLFKTGPITKKAVDGLNINMYENEVTVLLGHNGAGKTTTMSILTGFLAPTSGDAIINGCSILNDMQGVRKSMGLCPQFNILFPSLTVDEHLYFFARLKGLTSKEAIQNQKQMTKVLKLEDKSQTLSHMLSGGMKRKLSVGIALSANSKYVILDEPTSGMDPSARRAIWSVLEEYKNKCSILLSTHFMDEADYLGDRIAIMASGKLRCSGSSLFLKNKFGVGYHIVLTKSENCDLEKLTQLFKENVEESEIERISGAEVSFVLPFHSSNKFPNLFASLDERSEELGISGYGATITTMEEVFLRVTEISYEQSVSQINQTIRERKRRSLRKKSVSTKVEYNRTAEDVVIDSEAEDKSNNSYFSKQDYNSGLKLWFQQLYALLIKRIIHTERNIKVAIAQLLVPVVFTVLAVINAKFPPFEIQNISRNLRLDDYGKTDVFVSVVGNSTNLTNFALQYQQQFTSSQIVFQTTNMRKSITDKHSKLFGEFSQTNVISAQFNETGSDLKVIGFYNAEAFHSAATSVLYADQAYIRFISGRKINLDIINSPLPRASNGRVDEEVFGAITGFFIAFNIVLGFSFLAASFIIFLVRERIDRAALLQRLAGVGSFVFWLSAYIWDFINFFIPCLLTLVIFAIGAIEEYEDQAALLLLLFVLYIWASLPFVYIVSFMFDIPSTALVRLTIFNIISGLGSLIAIYVLSLLDFDETVKILEYIFLFLPQFCLGQSFSDIYTNYKLNEACLKTSTSELYCNSKGIKFFKDYLAWEKPGVGKPVFFLFLSGVIFWIILSIIEYEGTIFKRLCLKSSIIDIGNPEDEDSDVSKEREKVNNTDLPTLMSQNRLVLKNLVKVYQKAVKNRSLVAVDKLCFAVPEAECFGLLGINGAGKTTTFKILTGDYKATSGTAYLDGFDIRKNLSKVQQRLGYCPQFDALIEQMTGSETLHMYARLRGVQDHKIAECVAHLGKILHFSEHLKKPCGTYRYDVITSSHD